MNFKKLAIAGAVALSLFGYANQGEAANNIASDDYIIINKTYNKLAFYQDKKLVSVNAVATGRATSLTPEGKFKIVRKIVNRPYYKGKIPGGDPRNPLGNRWLGIAVPGRGTAAAQGNEYAIHGNNNPSSIGTYASSGCVRMHDKEVETLYSKVLLNTPVYITRSPKSFAALTNDLGYIKPAAKPVAVKQTVVKAKFIGWEDSNSFEVKPSTGAAIVIRKGSVNTSGLKENVTYTFTYTKNQYGQNILTKYTK